MRMPWIFKYPSLHGFIALAEPGFNHLPLTTTTSSPPRQQRLAETAFKFTVPHPDTTIVLDTLAQI